MGKPNFILGKGEMVKGAVLSSAIASVAKSASSLSQGIDETCFHALCHAAEHGDSTFITRLLEAMGKGQRTSAVCAYVEEMSGGQLTVSYNSKKGAAKAEYVKGWTKDKFKIERARAVSVWDFAGDEKKPVVTLSDFYGFVFSRKAKLESVAKGETEWLGTKEELEQARQFVDGALAQIDMDAKAFEKQKAKDRERKKRDENNTGAGLVEESAD